MTELFNRIIAHFLISLTGVAFAAVVGILLGIFLTRVKAAAPPVIAFIEILQTIPSLAMLIILLIFFGLGNRTAVMAIFLYSLLPIVRNTNTGILSVDPSLLEAGRGMGMNQLQMLAMVEIPNAIPVIVAGLRVSLITAYGIVTIAVLVGGSGLGMYVYRGILSQNMSMLMTGAIPICVMAFITDLFMNSVEKYLSKNRTL